MAGHLQDYLSSSLEVLATNRQVAISLDPPKGIHVYDGATLVLILTIRGKPYFVHHIYTMKTATCIHKWPEGVSNYITVFMEINLPIK